jgi:hypothetical protein
MDRANAKRNQTLGLEVLQHTLQQAGCLPERSFADAEAFAVELIFIRAIAHFAETAEEDFARQ